MFLKSYSLAGVIEHDNTMLLQSASYSELVVNIVMIPKDSEAAKGRFETQNDGRCDPCGTRPSPNGCMLT